MELNALLQIIELFSRQHILIIGDVMLDETIWGDVRRISPEAPVPVVEAQRRTYSPGGAGNVAVNVTGLGGVVELIGVTGSDAGEALLRKALEDNLVSGESLVADGKRPTTMKSRIVAHSQQLVRVDTEDKSPLPSEMVTATLAHAEARIAEAGTLVLSDYEKGMVTPELAQGLIALAAHQKKPVIVDPKGIDFRKYRGATVITPNLNEAERASGITLRSDSELARASAVLLEQLPGTCLLITRGAQGMSLYAENTEPFHIPTLARNVFDVTGAGDTVVSALALALAAGASLKDAAYIANCAAGNVVGKLGTARVSLSELRDDLRQALSHTPS